MISLHAAFHSFIVLLGALCAAFEVSITTNDTVATGINVKSTISIPDGGTADAFRLYLATANQHGKAEGGSTNASCTLIQWITLDNQTISFAIPPSVGPASGIYSLQLSLWKNGDVFSYTVDSPTFALSGATGNTSAAYARIYSSLTADDIPCGSLVCVQGCERSFGAAPDMAQFRDCAAGCKDVVNMTAVRTATDPGQMVTSIGTTTASALQSASSPVSSTSASASAAAASGGVKRMAKMPERLELIDLCLAILAYLA